MTVFAPRETDPRETRAPLTPVTVQRLVELGLEVQVEAGIGAQCDHPDCEYEAAGGKVISGRDAALAEADFVFRVGKPAIEEISKLKSGSLHASFLDPFNDPEILQAMASAGITAVSLEMIPRSTLAQKMDALSSQANIAGYTAVTYAADRLNKILPMMMTPAGTVSPAKFFIIGIGVAGLQAIATAKRLGARVTAFDVRPEALEQAESLGAKALRIDLGGDTGGTDQGYARELTPEQLEKQRQDSARTAAYLEQKIAHAQEQKAVLEKKLRLETAKQKAEVEARAADAKTRASRLKEVRAEVQVLFLCFNNRIFCLHDAYDRKVGCS